MDHRIYHGYASRRACYMPGSGRLLQCLPCTSTEESASLHDLTAKPPKYLNKHKQLILATLKLAVLKL